MCATDRFSSHDTKVGQERRVDIDEFLSKHSRLREVSDALERVISAVEGGKDKGEIMEGLGLVSSTYSKWTESLEEVVRRLLTEKNAQTTGVSASFRSPTPLSSAQRVKTTPTRFNQGDMEPISEYDKKMKVLQSEINNLNNAYAWATSLKFGVPYFAAARMMSAELALGLEIVQTEVENISALTGESEKIEKINLLRQKTSKLALRVISFVKENMNHGISIDMLFRHPTQG